MNSDCFLKEMGIRISHQRREMHLTQEQLAEKMEVSIQTISCIELGKKAIRPENLANLCLHLNTSADYILYGKRNEYQMSSIIQKLSELPDEEYNVIQNLVNLLSRKKY